jgi:dihydroorotase
MPKDSEVLVLRGARIIDPAQAIDRIDEIVVANGKIAAIGGPIPEYAEIIDLNGHYVSPGWVDLHVHTYGTLGFADPDSIGIAQGVTTYVDAGGPGIGVMEEFAALLENQTVTDLYAGPYVRPMGIIGSEYIEGDIRSLMNWPITDWLDFMEAHPGLIRYLKVAALGSYGTGPLKMAKGLSEIINVPLYSHIGEFQNQPDDPLVYEIFNISQAGDIITHIYHDSGSPILDENGEVLPIVRDAERRGVIFDVGFGGFNFGWGLAEKAFAQDLRPHVISSDLQQFNVLGPVFSLAHIMGMFLHLGMNVAEIIDSVTIAPAKALSLDDRAGSLKIGMPADITVFKIEDDEIEAMDTYGDSRTMGRRFQPVMAFKNGVRHDSDLTLCQDEKNWMLQIAEDHVPEAAKKLKPAQLEFLRALSAKLDSWSWTYSLEELDLDMAVALQDAFHDTLRGRDLSLRDALTGTFACFLDNPFTMQIGLFLLQLTSDLALKRIREVVDDRQIAA